MSRQWITEHEGELRSIVEAELDAAGIEGGDRPVLVTEPGEAPVLADGNWSEPVRVRTLGGMRRQIRRWIASILVL